MTDLREILEFAPKGLKLYTPLFGEVEFMGFDCPGGKKDGSPKITLTVKHHDRCYSDFDMFGRYCLFPESECVIFPSKEWQSWGGYQNYLFKEGHFITNPEYNFTVEVGKEGKFYDPEGTEIDKRNYDLRDFRWATEREIEDFKKEVEFAQRDKTEIPPEEEIMSLFHVGDVIVGKDAPEKKYHVTAVTELGYTCEGLNFYIPFDREDDWKLAESEKPEHKFKPFDKILIKVAGFWTLDFYVNEAGGSTGDKYYYGIVNHGPECIPWIPENEKYLGTNLNV